MLYENFDKCYIIIYENFVNYCFNRLGSHILLFILFLDYPSHDKSVHFNHDFSI